MHNELEFKRKSTELKHTDFPVRKIFQAQRSVDKVMLTVFRDMKRSITIVFLEKGAVVKRASYY